MAGACDRAGCRNAAFTRQGFDYASLLPPKGGVPAGHFVTRSKSRKTGGDITGVVASLTENELDVLS